MVWRLLMLAGVLGVLILPAQETLAQEGAPIAEPRKDCPKEKAITPASHALKAAGAFEADYRHGGGCGKHDYCIGYDDTSSPGKSYVWMSHLHDGTDHCEALLMGHAAAQLPASVFSAKEIILLTGGAEVPLDPKTLYVGATTAQLVAACSPDLAELPSEYNLSSDGVFTATLMHGGGCATHIYCVGYSLNETTGEALVWMGHKSLAPDPCKAMLEGHVELKLPPEIVGAKSLALFLGAGIVTKPLAPK